MKRDMDLVRKILFYAEEHCSGKGAPIITGKTFDTEDAKVLIHVQIMEERNLIHGSSGRGGYALIRLTWEGYELLDNIRDDGRWSKIKNGMKKVGTFSMGVLQSTASAVASQVATGLLGS